MELKFTNTENTHKVSFTKKWITFLGARFETGEIAKVKLKLTFNLFNNEILSQYIDLQGWQNGYDNANEISFQLSPTDSKYQYPIPSNCNGECTIESEGEGQYNFTVELINGVKIAIKIEGNKESYQLTGKTDKVSAAIEGDFTYGEKPKIRFTYSSYNMYFPSRDAMFNFSEELKGKRPEGISNLFYNYIPANPFIQSLTNRTKTEYYLLKALFLIYNWFENYFNESLLHELQKNLYNSFIFDYTGNIGAQQEIYFIHEKYNQPQYNESLGKLIELNLLVSACFTINEKPYQTYFIPLIKPGVSREHFKTDSDPNGRKATGLWASILAERDLRLKQWVYKQM